jgi:hypothetical protein
MFPYFVYGFCGRRFTKKALERDGIMASTDEHDDGEKLEMR